MIKQVPSIEYKRIKLVSPSQLYSMKQCPYKMVLAEAFGKQPLLPFSPAAYLGTMLHKMLEQIAKGHIRTNEDFDKEFEIKLLEVENELRKMRFDFFIPLQGNVKDFGMKKYQARKHLNTGRTGNSNSSYSVASEKWLSSNDGTVGGKLDILIKSDNYVEITDVKTGAITENSLDDEGEAAVSIKDEYQIQLKLYAQLYFENFARYPDALSLIGLNKEKYPVPFAASECEAIYHEAKSLLQSTNRSIDKADFVANPNEANCKYCLYRPACAYYQSFLTSVDNMNDVRGAIKKVTKYLNGNISVWLENSGQTFHISALSQDFFDSLNNSTGNTISIYNLRRTSQEFSFTSKKTTMIYE